MKIISSMVLMISLFTNVAYGDAVSFRCSVDSEKVCVDSIVQELNGKQCVFDASNIRCQLIPDDTGVLYCDVHTANCGDATSNGGMGVTCDSGMKKVKIQNSQLSATWAISILWIWVRSMCVVE
ncbi:MAG: hypothetical protein H6623_00180 [Bdellovibrionaceae bacterium]|nr:hypothetical protein [Pseudobdellovibrionaceae bacterium]